jgi:predicted transcriptional regulator of viral defense system
MERKKRAMIYKTSKASGEILEKIKTEIESKGGIVKTEQLDALGIDYRRVLDFVESGELIRIKNGYYTDRIDRFTETELMAKLFPDGLLCMESALYAYGYLSEKPYGWRIAVDKNTSKSRFAMDYPKVIPYYTEPEALQIGASEIELEGVRFGIYDKERTICDCLKYESKMERSSFQAAIQAYIREEDKDISLLLEYAKARKVIKKVQSMIGVWL